ncbi:MAG: STAS domain-containing protein [Gammaproteobacteria bacterium]|nr:STAS domain-containing protein [Gammaproteobacteria bacterium]
MVGRILVADQDGVYILMFEGDVRLTLCMAVDGFLEKMFHDPQFRSVLVDLSKSDSIDSTSLGLLAKLSIKADKLFGYRPTLLSPRPDISRILYSMGFEDVFSIVEEPLEYEEQLEELPPSKTSREELRKRVLEAHRTLMAMNEQNRRTFQDLVETLESDAPMVMPRRCA